ncbi:MAG: S-layer homology domain-containing protein, partial [Actinomycetota bacterium]
IAYDTAAPVADEAPAPPPAPERAEPVPQPGTTDRFPAPLAGLAQASVDGAPATAGMTASARGITIAAEGVSLELDAPAPQRGRVPGSDARSDTALVLSGEGTLGLRTSGLAPHTPVRVWLLSRPELLLEVDSDEHGELASVDAPLPRGVGSCVHTVQVVGQDARARTIAISVGVWVQPDPPPFDDLDPADPYSAAVGCLSTRGIVVGTEGGSFTPGAVATRGQAASMIAAGLGLDAAAPSSSSYSDVVGTIHRAGIEVLHDEGFVQGFADGSFRPSQGLTGGQAATLLAAVGGFEVAEPPGEDGGGNGVHAPAVAALADIGIVSAGEFAADQPVTRSRFAALLADVLHMRAELTSND